MDFSCKKKVRQEHREIQLEDDIIHLHNHNFWNSFLSKNIVSAPKNSITKQEAHNFFQNFGQALFKLNLNKG